MDTPPVVVKQKAELEGKTSLERTELYLGNAELGATVPQRENGEPMLAGKQLTDMGLLVRPFWIDEPNDIEGKTYHMYIAKHPDFELSIRKGVAVRLLVAQKKLPKNWQIILKAGFRPVPVQQELLESVRLYLSLKHRDWDDEKLLEETRKLVADPSIRIPPHATGAAVDVEILDTNTGALLDMGARANTDGIEGWTYSPAIKKSQLDRRITLLQAMLAAGFANHPYEWWHFSYGDTIWALFYDKPETVYTLV